VLTGGLGAAVPAQKNQEAVLIRSAAVRLSNPSQALWRCVERAGEVLETIENFATMKDRVIFEVLRMSIEALLMTGSLVRHGGRPVW
jgi:hypothetical protein